MRDHGLEAILQQALDDGGRVWAVGDVHGFHATAERLLEMLNLGPEDHVVFLGDLIDRGPGSCEAVASVRRHPRCWSVKGNHEAMMVEQFTPERLNNADMDLQLWFHNGGRATVDGYIRAHTDIDEVLDVDAMWAHVADDRAWMTSLPTHMVLDRWRLVHAGYDPQGDMTAPDERALLWIRDAFHRATQPVDPYRTVVFGHTPTVSIPPQGSTRWGEVYQSSLCLDDGRPSMIGLDTCLYHRSDAPRRLTAFDLQSGEVRQVDRLEA